MELIRYSFLILGNTKVGRKLSTFCSWASWFIGTAVTACGLGLIVAAGLTNLIHLPELLAIYIAAILEVLWFAFSFVGGHRTKSRTAL